MAYYGYDPSAYMTDYSWAGDIGKAISATALKMPELIELNKQIKENNKFKETSYDASNKYIDQMDFAHVSNILSTMGFVDEVNAGEKVAKEKLKSRLPKFSDKTTNEEYASQLANAFFVPFLEAAKSKAGGGGLDFGSLFGNLNSGVVQEAIKKSSVGQDVLAQAKEQQQYDVGQTREGQEYNKGFERKYGMAPVPGTGETETAYKQTEGLKQDTEKSQFELQQQRSKELGNQVSNIVSNAESSMDVWNDDKFGELPSEARNKAFEVWRTRENDELKEQLKKMDAKLKQIGTGKDKPVAANVIDSSITQVTNSLLSAQQKLAQLNDKDKNINKAVRKTLVAEQKWRIKQIEERLKKLQAVQVSFTEGGDYTQGGLNKAYKQAEYTTNKEKADEEAAFINSYNSGSYKKAMMSEKKEKEKFISDYRDMFGTEPTVDPTGKFVPQFSSSTPMNPQEDEFKLKAQKIAAARQALALPDTPENKIRKDKARKILAEYGVK